MSRRLVLFSQPSPTVWEQLDVALFPEFLKERVFSYMPAEGDNDALNAIYTPIWHEYCKKNKAKFIFVDNSKRGEEAKDEAEKIRSTNILMITGGNTFKLLNNLRKSGLDSTIIEFWKRDGVVMAGFSAGAIILSPSIETARTGYGDANELGLTDLTGLGIVDFEIWPHFEPNQETVAAEYKTKSHAELKTISNEEVLIFDK